MTDQQKAEKALAILAEPNDGDPMNMSANETAARCLIESVKAILKRALELLNGKK